MKICEYSESEWRIVKIGYFTFASAPSKHIKSRVHVSVKEITVIEKIESYTALGTTTFPPY